MAKRTVRSGARRRSSPAGRKRRTSKATGGSQVIRLKPLYNEISRVLKQLQQVQKRRGPAGVALLTAAAAAEPDSIDRAIERLTQHQRDFSDMCGPTMTIPAR